MCFSLTSKFGLLSWGVQAPSSIFSCPPRRCPCWKGPRRLALQQGELGFVGEGKDEGKYLSFKNTTQKFTFGLIYPSLARAQSHVHTELQPRLGSVVLGPSEIARPWKNGGGDPGGHLAVSATAEIGLLRSEHGSLHLQSSLSDQWTIIKMVRLLLQVKYFYF